MQNNKSRKTRGLQDINDNAKSVVFADQIVYKMNVDLKRLSDQILAKMFSAKDNRSWQMK